MAITEGCDTCNKSTLSLMLLRPSPVAKMRDLLPPGADAVTSDTAVMAGLLPARLPTESRFALRMLRSGYVHVYIAKPPAGIKNWLVYRVTKESDLVEEKSEWFAQPTASVTCPKSTHNKMGMKLLNLPQAHLISEIWIAYSANLWNKALRDKNKANPKAMQKISLAGGSPNTFAPTAANLKSKVLECAMSTLREEEAAAYDFAFNSVVNTVDKLADNLVRAAACHPKTKGKELAIVLRDPVGIATELNALRLRRHELAKAEMAKPDNVYALNSIHLIQGMEQQLIDAESIDSYTAVSPLRTKEKYDAETWPADTQWEPVTPQDRQLLVASAGKSILTRPYKMMFERSDLGRVIYPDHDERVQRWTREQADKTWLKIADEFKVSERKQWLDDFETLMQSQHFAPQERMEEDWWAACNDALFKESFTLQYDEADSNTKLALHSPGQTYTREIAQATTPAPFSKGQVLTQYLQQLMADVTQPDALMLRALVCNQKDLIGKVKTALEDADPADHLHANRNDKLYDLGNGLSQGPLARYGWASGALAAVTGGYALNISQSLIAAAMVPVAAGMTKIAPAAAGAAAGLNTLDAARLARSLGVQLVQQTVTMSMESLAQGKGLRTPVLITRDINISTMLRLIAGDTSPQTQKMASQLERLKRGQRSVRISVLTDNKALAQAGGDLKPLIKADPSSVAVGSNARASQAGSVAAATMALNQTQFNTLFRGQAGIAQRAALAVREGLQSGRAIVTSLGGQLALGTMLINGVGFLNNLAAIRDPKDAQAVRYAWYGLYDAGAGVLGGLMEVLSVGATAQAMARASTGATVTSLTTQSGWLTGLRLGAAAFGAVAGIVNGAANWARSEDAISEGDKGVGYLYRTSSVAFYGLAATGVSYAAGVASNYLTARGIGGAAVRTISLRLGTAAAASALTGYGLLFLGAGLAFEVGAVILTPTPLEKWARRTRFGNNRNDRFGSWKEELMALDEALKKANPTVEKKETAEAVAQ